VASIGQIRGALLEEIVLFLLSRTGYRIVGDGEDGTRPGGAGLELRGRGEWHQIDALVTPTYSLPFMYPLRLMIEAKCYAKSRKTDVRIVRAAIGTALDVNQSYSKDGSTDIEIQQFNYHAAIFCTSGYTEDAQRLAAAHQVFLIDYTDVPALTSVVDALLSLSAVDFGKGPNEDINIKLGALRTGFRHALFQQGGVPADVNTVEGDPAKLGDLVRLSRAIAGSYYGMIQGTYPIHLLATVPISMQLMNQWEIPVRLRVLRDGREWFSRSQHITTRVLRNTFVLSFSCPRRLLRFFNVD
jgi:hypothetical protein